MKIANQQWRIRGATRQDSGAITALLRDARWTHYHADWRLPGDWLGSPGFVVAEPAAGGPLAGCICIAADPPPAAWVRLAALRHLAQGQSLLQQMMAPAVTSAREQGLTEVAWLIRQDRVEEWLPALNMVKTEHVVTYLQRSLELPTQAPRDDSIMVQPVRLADLERLVEIERAAFDPIWRHSHEGLALGWQHALSFYVAVCGSRVVGFQYTARSDQPHVAHLVRLTVAPEMHRKGVGSALLTVALESARDQGYEQMSLNTQAGNLASQQLYERFGFVRIGFPLPVWIRRVK